MEYIEAKIFIDSFSKRGRLVTDLSRFENLMDKLDNPQDKLKFIHVAGTNGKGSTVRYCATVFTESGYKTGEYTSPFIIDYTDRIRINGVNISENTVGKYAEMVKEAAGENKDYSQFEITTAIAFLYFADEKCDIVCLEVGIGGLLDATNIIKKPLCSVIVSIGLDHTAVLGNTITDIGKQKAGIIKENCPIIFSPLNKDESRIVVKETAKCLNSQFIEPSKTEIEVLETSAFGNKFKYKGIKYELFMGGKHQIFNAVTAIEAINTVRSQGFTVSERVIQKGLRDAKVPSRAEVFRKEPLVLLDGAHNPSGMESLRDILQGLKQKPVIVVGMLEEKAVKDSLKEIIPFVKKAVCLDSFSLTAMDKAKVADIFIQNGIEAVTFNNYEEAVNYALYEGAKCGTIFCGSLYLASEIRKILVKKFN